MEERFIINGMSSLCAKRQCAILTKDESRLPTKRTLGRRFINTATFNAFRL
jgi:hypothetical protein